MSVNRLSGTFIPSSPLDPGAVQANGRIDLLSAMPALTLLDRDSGPQDNRPFAREALLGNVAASESSTLFFSPKNIEALQQGIRYRVYVETQGRHVIGRQGDTDLKVIMRSIYLQHGRNVPRHMVLAHVRELNGRVLEYAVPDIVGSLQQREAYFRDASTLPMPNARAQPASLKGSKCLEAKPFI